jgi:hypothetical protein
MYGILKGENNNIVNKFLTSVDSFRGAIYLETFLYIFDILCFTIFC